MADIIMPPKIGEDGSMALRRRAGAKIEFSFVDDDGNPHDVSARTYFFEVDTLRVQLQNGTSTDMKVLILTRTQVESLVGKPRSFVVLDETAGQQLSDDIWANTLLVVG